MKEDSTAALDGKLYLIEEKCTAKKVLFEERLDGSLRIVSEGESPKHRVIAERPKKTQKNP